MNRNANFKISQYAADTYSSYVDVKGMVWEQSVPPGQCKGWVAILIYPTSIARSIITPASSDQSGVNCDAVTW